MEYTQRALADIIEVDGGYYNYVLLEFRESLEDLIAFTNKFNIEFDKWCDNHSEYLNNKSTDFKI